VTICEIGQGAPPGPRTHVVWPVVEVTISVVLEFEEGTTVTVESVVCVVVIVVVMVIVVRAEVARIPTVMITAATTMAPATRA
jgi:hypothetical protein